MLDPFLGHVQHRFVAHVEEDVDVTVDVLVWGRLRYKDPDPVQIWVGSDARCAWISLEEFRLHNETEEEA